MRRSKYEVQKMSSSKSVHDTHTARLLQVRHKRAVLLKDVVTDNEHFERLLSVQ
jgi:hypothetical protein